MTAESRVIVPVTRLSPATARLLNKHAPGHVRAPVQGMDGYWALMDALWADGRSFVIVEHDIGLHAQVLPQFEECPSWWCGFRYQVDGGNVIAALGCTRFRRDLLEAEPDLLQVVGEDASAGLPAKDWRRLDVRMQDALHARGYRRCEHTPNVKHYHRYEPFVYPVG